MKTILYHFFERNGITVILRDGNKFHETTPDTMTSGEHLAAIIRRLP